jgi:hypothetical protein
LAKNAVNGTYAKYYPLTAFLLRSPWGINEFSEFSEFSGGSLHALSSLTVLISLTSAPSINYFSSILFVILDNSL